MVYTSPWPSQAPYTPSRLPASAGGRRQAQRPDKVAFMTPEGKSWTFAEYWKAANGMARALQDQGHQEGRHRSASTRRTRVEYARRPARRDHRRRNRHDAEPAVP